MTGKIKIFSLILSLLVAGAISFYLLSQRVPFEEQKPALGDTMPPIALADLSGSMFRLADHAGKVILVNFWASWCPPCKSEMPGFQKVFLTYQDKGFSVVAVAINEITAAEIKELGILFPVLVANERVKRDFGDIAHPPVSFLVARDGKIIKKVNGVYSEDQLKSDVERALSGR